MLRFHSTALWLAFALLSLAGTSAAQEIRLEPIPMPQISGEAVTHEVQSPVSTPATVAAPSTIAPLTTTYYAPAVPTVTAQAVTTYRTTYLAPAIAYSAPVNAFRPVAPVAPAPVVVLSPVGPAIPAPVAPVTALAPVAPMPPVVAVPVGPPVIVRPKVYVPGQPIRNFIRGITP